MIMGSSTYVIYVAANIHEINYILFIAAALEGFGAAVLWVCQGTFITKCAYDYTDKYKLDKKSQLGYYNGLFWAMWVGNAFIGNLLAALLFEFGTSDTVVYIVLTSVNVIGVLFFLFIRKFDSELIITSTDIDVGLIQHNISEIDDDDDDKIDIMSAIRLWTDHRLHLLILFTLYSGISQAYVYGNFPSRIDNKSKKFFAMSIFGLFDATFSMIFGRLSDKIGRLQVLSISFLCHGSVFVYFYFYNVSQNKYYIFFIIAVFLGIGDAGFNIGLNSLYPSLLGEKSTTFGNLKFWQSLAMTWGFLWQSDWINISRDNIQIACLALMICAAIPLYLSKTVRDASRPKLTKTSDSSSEPVKTLTK